MNYSVSFIEVTGIEGNRDAPQQGCLLLLELFFWSFRRLVSWTAHRDIGLWLGGVRRGFVGVLRRQGS
jgi:hypothetical protein